MLLGAPGRTTRSKKLLGARASLLGARTLLGATGRTTTTRSKGIATRSKDAARGSWPYYY